MLKFKFRSVARSTLYFGKWQYVIAVHFPQSNCLRVLKHSAIDQYITYRNSWVHRRGPLGDRIDDIARASLHVACEYLLNRKNPYKKIVCGNGMWLYTNTPEDFEDLDLLDNLCVMHAHEVELSMTPDVVMLKNPRHTFRTFFRERWLETDHLKALQRYFLARPGQFRLSPGFRNLVEGRRMWLMSNYFVDHDEPNADFLINMAVPGVVRKTMPIVKRDK